MADDREPDSPPEYTVYRSRPRLFKRREKDPLGSAAVPPPAGEPRAPRGAPVDDDRPYTVHRAGRGDGGGGKRLRVPKLGGRGGARRISPGRIVKWLLVAAVAWVALSLVLFLVSAQIQREGISDAAGNALDDGGYTLTSPNTILVLGSDARTASSKEPGANKIGEAGARADTIMLMRAGGGASARLSIPRDTVVDIPGHGRNKINAAYAIGGPELAVETVKAYLGIEVHHLVEVNFANFPDFIDSLGGIDVRTGCVVSRINGGFRNGGYTLRLRAGENHLDGKAALALARTRKNDCRKNEGDLTRARRQQKILAAIRSRIVSPATFVRLPLVSWAAPKAIRSDMAGPSLLGLFGAVASTSSPPTRILKPSGTVTLPDGGAGLEVDPAERTQEVGRFLRD